MTIGAQLQQARKERHLTLTEVMQATKIQPWVLEALEADRLQELMSPIYVKGFVTTYAKFLGCDPVSLTAQLPRPAADVSEPPLSEPPHALAARSLEWLTLRVRRLAAAAVLGVAVIGLIMVSPLRRVAQQSLPVVNRPVVASVSSPHPEPAPQAPALPTLTLLATQPLELDVSAARTTWIQVRADGKLLTQQRFDRGAKERWTAKKQFELVIAKPAHVEVVLNGHTISPLAIGFRGRLLITHRGVTKLPE